MRKSKGFTLLELLITIAILGIIITPLSSMVLTSVKFTKVSEDKQKATNLAQKYMEKIKSGVNLNSYNLDEGNFHVDCSIEPVEGYEFKHNSVSGENGSDSIASDYKIVFPKQSEVIQFYNNNQILSIPQQNVVKPYIKIHSMDNDIVFTLRDEEKKTEDERTIGHEKIIRSSEKEKDKIKIRIDILRDLPNGLTISADNESSDILELYFVKADKLSSSPEIIVEKHGGKIRQYNDILKIEDNSSISNEANKRLYKIVVKVTDKKTGETLSVNKGYKTFLK
ncbi:prepilin-type N-terminal cleavage/methylation domain-containing protein [Clostridium ganghwense]|uniref:Prepilin-type N-terminal cleavage/methylation domain-containing protein n=1 Tax=Clostridium ganghwense TaxID=312089 RepID=A0ABT4CPC2_9CLOT|nr:prepilin-type N-terminal cleavage/methylation domain-containing protein [Clostridium ganghwense]MCY6370909.1 prepilin-type N-terminal cleavage/methylation domain-containing protein [Clostridium ganghwense]